MGTKEMKRGDLKIGNLIYDMSIYDKNWTGSGHSKIIEVDVITLLNLEIPNFSYKPIPLTEEWLEKFGFVNNGNTNVYVKNIHKIGAEKLKSLAVYIDEKKYCVAIMDYYTGVEKIDLLHMDYTWVHQLQNLYFALTGEELVVKGN